MKILYPLFFALLATGIPSTTSSVIPETPEFPMPDSLRIAELDQFWNQLAETVRQGDLEGYAAAYHEDAVVVFAGNTSVPIEVALKSWEKGFLETRAGDVSSNVQFLLTERIGDASTAYETGMFLFSVTDKQGKVQNYYAHLQALLVKKDGAWTCIMEYQAPATEEEWNSLKDAK